MNATYVKGSQVDTEEDILVRNAFTFLACDLALTFPTQQEANGLWIAASFWAAEYRSAIARRRYSECRPVIR